MLKVFISPFIAIALVCVTYILAHAQDAENIIAKKDFKVVKNKCGDNKAVTLLKVNGKDVLIVETLSPFGATIEFKVLQLKD